MDEELAQSRRLRAVGEMVGGIAHEFNNLLTPIVLKVEMLRDEREDPVLRHELEVISGAAERAATLTKRLLTFGRKGDQEPVEVQLADVVAANVDLIRPTCDRRVELAVDVPPGLPALVQNPADLHQIVLNLLLNARDALHDKLQAGGDGPARLTLAVEPIGSNNGHGPAGQRIVVGDTGVGMPRHVLERIFEPFFTTKEVGRGTGLGLATVWHLVQTCGGRVDVESAPGVGTTFRVELPTRCEGETPGNKPV
jgi:signal transduction histidine kinase